MFYKIKLACLLALLLVFASCESFRFDSQQKKHQWKGTISLLVNTLISSAHAEDEICQSQCTTSRCAHLVVHQNSTVSEIVCSTNATTSYEFNFSQDPNDFYDGKIIEIKIEDISDASNNRSYVEVIDSQSPQNEKHVDLENTFIAPAIKGQLFNAIANNNGDGVGDIYRELSEEITISDINNVLKLLTSTDLLTDMNATSSIEIAQDLVTKLKPEFLGTMLKLSKESSREVSAYVMLDTLCSDNLSKAINTTSGDPALPYCYLRTDSLSDAEPVAWNPVDELPAGCVLNYVTYQAICEDPVTHLLSIENLPAQPSAIGDYTLASTYLDDNFENHKCFNSSIRFGAFVIQDRSIALTEDGLDYSHNQYWLVKAYSICQNDPAAYAYCSQFDDDAIAAVQSELAAADFCYF